MEMWAPLDEEDRIGDRPDAFIEHSRLCTSWDECDTVAMLRHPPQPANRFATKRWITPDPAMPLLRQTVMFDGKMLGSGCPGTNDRRTRIEVKQP